MLNGKASLSYKGGNIMLFGLPIFQFFDISQKVIRIRQLHANQIDFINKNFNNFLKHLANKKVKLRLNAQL